MKFNIFQGDERLLRVVSKTLGYEESEYNITRGIFTDDIYFTTFFYLTKRFGKGEIFDDYKDAGVWSFEVKDYTIQIYMNSSWVQFMIFGRKGNITVHSPYVVKMNREIQRNSSKYVSLFKSKHTALEERILREQFELFKSEKGIDESKISGEEFNEFYRYDWYNWMQKYNDEIINVDRKEFLSKYGDIYQNAYTRHALKTLEQFLKNMLTAIWIRDVPYNLKGRMTDEEARFYERYIDNIKIIFKA